MDWVIATGVVTIFNIIDDHSRVGVRSRAVDRGDHGGGVDHVLPGRTTVGAACGVLSDNGLCFSGKLRGFEVFFEANLRDAGIRPITGRPFHPQTTGKVERFQQTLKKWLRRQPLAGIARRAPTATRRVLSDLQPRTPPPGHRPGDTASRWMPRPDTHQPTARSSIRVSRGLWFASRHERSGRQGADRSTSSSIGIGVGYTGVDTTVIIDDDYANVYINDQLVRHLKIDHSRYYQPTGHRRVAPPTTPSILTVTDVPRHECHPCCATEQEARVLCRCPMARDRTPSFVR